MPLHIPPPLISLLSLPPSTYIQFYFVLLASGVLALQLLPALQEALLSYGPRNAEGSSTTRNPVVSLLRQTGILVRVPHAWFSHFYVALLTFQLFWAAQFITKGRVLSAIVLREAENGGGAGMGLAQVMLAWGMLTLQGARRLYECWAVMRPSASQMLGVHWVLSVLVYLSMSMAVWIEGSGKTPHFILCCREAMASCHLTLQRLASILDGEPFGDDAEISTLRTAAAIGLFIGASTQQHQAHKHLASLRKYTLPHQGLFRYIVCPHYTCECLIYVALAIASAPQAHLLNRTLLSGLFFVMVNLGATAKNTKVWYAEKFGAGRVPRWRMVPLIF